ncbi:MAG: hypothetical protein IMZ66_05210 [Planctomycetes bacterium]|nr:hypothetical protein [Planctomycetota bacterium]
MRPLTVAALAALVAACGGCMPSVKLEEGQLDHYIALTHGIAADAAPYRPSLGTRLLPSRWIIQQKPSVVWSTISLLRAAERLKEGADQIELSVSPAHAKTLADVFAQARAAVEDLREISASDGPMDRQRWAQGLATALARIESVSRLATLEGAARQSGGAAEPMGMAAEPMLELVALYLNEQTSGNLLGDLSAQDISRLRTVLAQLALRLGFAAAGKQPPDDLRDVVVARMEQADRVNDLEVSLRGVLAEAADRASPSPAAAGLAGTLRTVLGLAPPVLKALESLVSQWDRIDRVEIELCRAEERIVVAATVHVLPGKEVRIARPAFYIPVIALRGTSRIVVQPELPGTGETVVSFEPVDDGAVEMRFEGPAYALARLMVVPLADGALREVRVFSTTRPRGTEVTHVALLMEAKGAKGDPRRMLLYQDVRHKDLVREPFSVRSVVEQTEQVFNYLTPDRRYTYQRLTGPQG